MAVAECTIVDGNNSGGGGGGGGIMNQYIILKSYIK